MSEQTFSISINNNAHELTRENTVVYLFRQSQYQDLDFLQIINHKDESLTNVYRNPELCRWMGGLAFKSSGAPYVPKNSARDSFADIYGWNADVIIQDVPSDEAQEGFAFVEITKDIHEDGSWDFPEAE